MSEKKDSTPTTLRFPQGMKQYATKQAKADDMDLTAFIIEAVAMWMDQPKAIRGELRRVSVNLGQELGTTVTQALAERLQMVRYIKGAE